MSEHAGAAPAQPFKPPSIHNTEPITMDDVLIISGSFAGLAPPFLPSVTQATWQGAMAGILAHQSMLT